MPELFLGDCHLTVETPLAPHTCTWIAPAEVGAPAPMAVAARSVGFRPNVVLTRAGEPVAPARLAQYVDEQVAALTTAHAWRQLGREAARCGDGSPAILQHHSFDSGDGVVVEQLQLYAVIGGTAVVVTATHLAGPPFAAWRGRFLATLTSLKAAA